MKFCHLQQHRQTYEDKHLIDVLDKNRSLSPEQQQEQELFAPRDRVSRDSTGQDPIPSRPVKSGTEPDPPVYCRHHVLLRAGAHNVLFYLKCWE